ncbi:hypothetical protein [Pontixanthobacter aquaemixtae]|uniref:Uncharacterized protein n=1 Tax=Pontixanthobacter aquaemixtae TaxID=1958940 RepID=A0A844ZV22_9SPHN|nr:hypothetical protein [Pontixanthobacter aquaemixtae]MXO91132.1 hypothetical protein [Pontixanthobacter aquaemixtae]
MKFAKFLLGGAAIAMALPMPAFAQDENVVVVTGSRSDRSSNFQYYDDSQSAIGFTRKADYFVKPIYVNSDSRGADLRRDELFSMLRATIEQAGREGISLIAGDYGLRKLTVDNMEKLTVRSGGRPDTSQVTIYARLPVAGDDARASLANERIETFAKSIPVTGRSFIQTGSISLAIDDPDQYRIDVVRSVATESRRYASLFGSDYGVEIRGLDSELFWQQASETEVFLYIKHSFVVSPK